MPTTAASDFGKRHQKIVGDFGELLVAHMLSREGFSVAHADQEHIDLVASRPDGHNGFRRLAVSVKARSRVEANMEESVKVLDDKGGKVDSVKGLQRAAAAFAAEPWIATYAEGPDRAYLFLGPLDAYRSGQETTTTALPMTANAIAKRLASGQFAVIEYAINRSLGPLTQPLGRRPVIPRRTRPQKIPCRWTKPMRY